MSSLRSNFTNLQEHDEQLLCLGMLAERYFADDPNTCLLKLRQLAEMLTSSVGEALFALANWIEARLATAQCVVERLTPATLSKAFCGALVPPDLNDESASQLLERLAPTTIRRKR